MLSEKLERNLLDPRANKFHGKLRKVKKGGRSTNRPRPVRFFFFFHNEEKRWANERKKKGEGRKVARNGFERTGVELTFGVFFLISPPRFFEALESGNRWADRFVRIFE